MSNLNIESKNVFDCSSLPKKLLNSTGYSRDRYIPQAPAEVFQKKLFFQQQVWRLCFPGFRFILAERELIPVEKLDKGTKTDYPLHERYSSYHLCERPQQITKPCNAGKRDSGQRSFIKACEFYGDD